MIIFPDSNLPVQSREWGDSVEKEIKKLDKRSPGVIAIGGSSSSGEGTVGPTGPQGPQGPQGEPGLTGPIGTNGADGMNGLDGINGLDGMNGQDGAPGADGAEGPQGPQGDIGPEGPQGIQGDVGPQGPAGADGLNGTNGADGATGPQGPQGDQGPQGIQGETGSLGPIGPQGATGPQGLQGDQGLTGLSAYQVAQLEGFTGTEPEWLATLKGAGYDGHSTTSFSYQSVGSAIDLNIGTNLAYVVGNNVIISVDTLDPPVAMLGEIASYDDATGDAVVYITSSPGAGFGPYSQWNIGLIGATGPTGSQGPAGADGETGPAGADGTNGLDGADGAQGDPGVGIPTGGDAGQILAKLDGTDYNTTWIDNYANWTSQVKHEVKLGEAIAKGQAVYVSSADGTNMIVSKASNATEATSSKTLGLLELGGSANAKVKLIAEGLLSGLDTSTATAGDPVWLGTAGNLIYGLTNKPVAPAHLVFIGVVTRSNSNNGEIFVKPQNGFEFRELHDVLIESPADNEVMAYDSASSLWKNQTPAEAGIATVEFAVPTGAMMMWYTNTAPTGWQICDGSASGSAALIAVIGANTPNMKTRVPVGKGDPGTAFQTIGSTGGAESVSLSQANIPSHTHTGGTGGIDRNHQHDAGSFYAVSAGAHAHNVGRDTDGAGGSARHTVHGAGVSGAGGTSPTSNTGAHTHDVEGWSGTVSSDHAHPFTTDGGAGLSGSANGSAHNNMQPYIVVNYIIKL